MNVIVFVLIVAILALVVFVVSGPLRARSASEAPAAPDGDGPRSDDLVAERDAKYQEIRDAELDFRTGKLSREDYERIDAGLRAEAIEILDRIEDQPGTVSEPPRSA